jgi:hypothetical protein
MPNFAPEELMQEAYKLLAKDRARLGSTNYPVYKGQTTSPMSVSTQRARELREKFSREPSPYSQKISSVLSRDNQGITQQDIQGILGRLGQEQRTFGQGPLLDTLRQEFLSSYDPRIARFVGKTERDIGRSLPETEARLQEISKASGNLEGSRNQQIARTLQGLQQNKQGRREALIGNLEQFGAQRHGYNNLVNAASKAEFEREKNEPHRRMQLLEEALAPHAAMGGEGGHHDLEKSRAESIAQALRAYGVDPSLPASSWETSRQTPSKYPGQLMASSPAEIEASRSVLQNLNPELRDSYTDQRRGLTRQLVDTPKLSTKALQGLTPAMQAQISSMEREAQQRMKKDLGMLNGEYIRLGQYGSLQHMRAAEERARDINKATLQQRDALLQNALKSGLQAEHSGDITNIKQLGLLGKQSQKDYGDLLQDIQNTNKLGATKFANTQAENEELYKNYQNENLWQWPHMRNTARNEAYRDIFRGLDARDISLDNLAALNTRYSELERERAPLQQPLTSAQQARDALQRQSLEMDLRQKYLAAKRDDDEVTNWWNTGGSRSGDTAANWKRVQAARDKLAAIDKEVRASKSAASVMSAASADSSARHAGYSKAWDEEMSRRSQAELQRLTALKQGPTPMSEGEARMKAEQDRQYLAQGYVPSGVGWIKHNPDAGWIGARLQPR